MSALCTFAAVCGVGALALAGDKLEYAPKLAAIRRKELNITHYLNLQSMGTSRDGGAVINDQTTGTVSTWERAVFLDRVDQLDVGRPAKLLRTFDEGAAGGSADLVFAGTNAPGRIAKQNSQSTSALVKHDVLFTWVPAEKVWSRLYDHLDGEESMLAGLDVDTDFFGALPGKEVASGDAWEVPLSAASSFFAPGGTLELVPASKKQFPRLMKVAVGADLGELLSDPKGSFHAKYGGRRTVDGVECGVIALELKLTLDCDRTRPYVEYMPEEEGRDPAQLRDCTVHLEIDGKGELLWNIGEKRFEKYELSASETVRVAATKNALTEGDVKTLLMQQSEFQGALKITFVNGAPKPASDAKTPAESSGVKKP